MYLLLVSTVLNRATATLRPAVRADIPVLKAWDEKPHVRLSDPSEGAQTSGWNWDAQIEAGWPGVWDFIAELDGAPIGYVQVIDPEVEPSQYWGPTPAGHRAIDLWIGPPQFLGQGHGGDMMRQALSFCFEAPEVHTVLIDPLVSNEDAIRFYQRLGFQFVETRTFETDRCAVHHLTRSTYSELYQQGGSL